MSPFRAQESTFPISYKMEDVEGRRKS